jgi:hypothetical protein
MEVLESAVPGQGPHTGPYYRRVGNEPRFRYDFKILRADPVAREIYADCPQVTFLRTQDLRDYFGAYTIQAPAG